MPDEFTREYKDQLWSRRHRPVRPHFISNAITVLIRELAELLDAIGFQFDDRRWSDSAENMHAAIDQLVRKSRLYEWIAAREHGEPPPAPRAAVPRLELLRAPLRLAQLPRKGIAFVRPKLEAAMRVRRRRQE